MAGVPGKNKITRGIRVSVDNSAGQAKDLSSDLVPGSLNGLGFKAGEIEMTGESETTGNYLPDRKENELSMQFYVNDTATTGSTTVLNGIPGTVVTVLVELGSLGAAPSTGDPTFSGEFCCLDVSVSSSGGKLIHSCSFKPSGATPPAWGTKA